MVKMDYKILNPYTQYRGIQLFLIVLPEGVVKVFRTYDPKRKVISDTNITECLLKFGRKIDNQERRRRI